MDLVARLVALEIELASTLLEVSALLMRLVPALLCVAAGLGLVIAAMARLCMQALPKPILLSLPHSHYVELARWALRRAGGPPVAELTLPVGPHIPIFGALRLIFGRSSSGVSTTSFPGSQDDVRRSSRFQAWSRRAAAAPALITDRGVCIPDSWGILAHAGESIDAATRDELDMVVGPAVRQVAYFYVFKSPGMFRRVQATACASWAMAAFDAWDALFRLESQLMPQLMDISQEGVNAAVLRLRTAFERASTVLVGDPFLGSGGGGEAFGGADLAWCALVGWLLLPPNFLGGAIDPLPRPSELPAGYRALRAELKETRAGRHVAFCYTEYR